MKKKKLRLKKHWKYIFSIVMIFTILFSVSITFSGYKSSANVSIDTAVPIVNIESGLNRKILEFNEYGWATYGFDIVNGKIGSNGTFYINEIDMEYYIQAVKDSGSLDLNLKGLYRIKDDGTLDEGAGLLPYVEGKGYGPFNLEYKKDDTTILNPAGYYESKYIKREHYLLVYTYGSCGVGDTNCKVDVGMAGKDYKFHIEVKAYQKIS